jgi:hypothetical protein
MAQILARRGQSTRVLDWVAPNDSTTSGALACAMARTWPTVRLYTDRTWGRECFLANSRPKFFLLQVGETGVEPLSGATGAVPSMADVRRIVDKDTGCPVCYDEHPDRAGVVYCATCHAFLCGACFIKNEFREYFTRCPMCNVCHEAPGPGADDNLHKKIFDRLARSPTGMRAACARALGNLPITRGSPPIKSFAMEAVVHEAVKRGFCIVE